MTGFKDIVIAMKPSNGGNVAIKAVMGPDTKSFANLSPVNAGVTLKLATTSRVADTSLDDLFNDSAETMTVDAWNIYMIMGRTAGQKNLQFQVTNNSGGESTIEFGFMRLV